MGGNSIKDVVKVPAIKIVCIVRNAYLGPSKTTRYLLFNYLGNNFNRSVVYR